MSEEQKNAADPAQIKDAERRERLSADEWKQDLKWIFSSRRGRRFYNRMMKQCGIHELSFRGDEWTQFREGQRNIGLKMLTELMEVQPQVFITMIEEDNKENS